MPDNETNNGKQMAILLERTDTILGKVNKMEIWQSEFQKCYNENQLNSTLERAAISAKTTANEKDIIELRAELKEQRAEQERQKKITAEVETLIRWSKVIWGSIVGLIMALLWGLATGSITIVVP